MHPHLRWSRLPEVSVWRPPPAVGGARTPLREDARVHGKSLADTAKIAVEAGNVIRRRLGIAPSRLRVLRFTFLGVEERALLERLGAQILDEDEERARLESPYYEVLVEFASAEQASSFRAVEPVAPASSRWWLPQRDSSGGASPTRVRVCFRDKIEAKAFIADDASAVSGGYTPKAKEPTRISANSTFKVLVEFASDESLREIASALRWYRQTQSQLSGLTEIQARQLFDALTSVDTVAPEDRRGARLAQGTPRGERFFLDVDLWHPGSQELVAEAIRQFHEVLTGAGGRGTDGPTAIAQTLLLARVDATAETLEALLAYDRVAYVDLPPAPNGESISVLTHIDPPTQLSPVPPDGPLACLVDSGVVAAHPLLAGLVVDERDFGSGEDTPVDQCGHGTHLAGLIVYGDVARCVREGRWEPRVRLLSAKVMRHVGNGVTGFDEHNERTVPTQLQDAIRTFSKERGCRVFNLSLGDGDRPYSGGRQLPWALTLDELARELDVVLVVSSGNVQGAKIPGVRTSPQFETALREQLFAGGHPLIDPACALLALTVGAVARTATPFARPDRPDARPPLVGAPVEAPPPFARVGHVESVGAAPQRAVKPDVCAYGGNLALNAIGTDWRKHELALDEPSLNFRFQEGRLLAGLIGSSPAAAAVTHCCAVVEAELRRGAIGDYRPTANLIRALVVHSARPANELNAWMEEGEGKADGERRRLRVAGHGRPDPDRAAFSTDSRVVLVAEDTIEDEQFHLYELELPDTLMIGTGTRRIRVTLAFDPPVRGTRREYLGRTMWFQLFRGTTSDRIRAALAKRDSPSPGEVVSRDLPSLKSRPSSMLLEWSTVQSAEFKMLRPRVEGYRAEPERPAMIHILVGSSLRFAADASTSQRYALVSSIEHDDTRVKFYQVVRQQVERLRERLRARTSG